jgi:spore maturation protein CgeB
MKVSACRVQLWGLTPIYAMGSMLARGFEALGHKVDYVPYREWEPEKWPEIKDCDVMLLMKGLPCFDKALKAKVESRADGVKAGLWFPDDPHQHKNTKVHGKSFDMVFTAHKPAVETYREEGIAASWLPFACDPDMHYRIPSTPVMSDVVYVGGVYGGERQKWLDLVNAHSDFRQTKAFGKDFAAQVNSAKLAFNKSGNGEMNMRVFECMGCGVPLLTDEVPGQDILFASGLELFTYRTEEDLIWFLENFPPEDKLQEVGRKGQDFVYAHHTYWHRAEQILERLYES